MEPKSIEPGVEELERLVGTGRLHPDDADAVLGEFLFQQSFLLQDHRHRVVGRPVDMDLPEGVGSKGRTWRQDRNGDDRRQRAS